jgi:hypothetical protein
MRPLTQTGSKRFRSENVMAVVQEPDDCQLLQIALDELNDDDWPAKSLRARACSRSLRARQSQHICGPSIASPAATKRPHALRFVAPPSSRPRVFRKFVDALTVDGLVDPGVVATRIASVPDLYRSILSVRSDGWHTGDRLRNNTGPARVDVHARAKPADRDRLIFRCVVRPLPRRRWGTRPGGG